MNLCWLNIHKWSKWNLLKTLYNKSRWVGSKKINEYDFRYQERSCTRCGLTQTSRIEYPVL